MRVTHLLFSLTTGGIETMLTELANAQRPRHYVSVVILSDRTDRALLDALHPDIAVTIVGRPPGSRNPLWPLRLRRALRRTHPDIVHLHHADLIPWLRLTGLRTPSLLTFHHAADDGTWSTRHLKHVGAVAAISPYVARTLADKGVSASLVENAIPVARFRSRTTPPTAIRRCLAVGRLTYQKGQDLLIDALATLPYPDLTLTLVGTGPLEEQLRRAIARHGLQQRVTLAGAWPPAQVQQHMADYDLLVLPSRTEGFGLTVAEALAAGLGVLVPDSGGAADVIEGGRYGATYAAGSAGALADALRRLYRDGYPATLHDGARAHVAARYDIPRLAADYDTLYRNLAAPACP